MFVAVVMISPLWLMDMCFVINNDYKKAPNYSQNITFSTRDCIRTVRVILTKCNVSRQYLFILYNSLTIVFTNTAVLPA